MKTSSLSKQSGVLLLEALIAILIFSLGILALLGLQASSISNVAQSKYRTDASYLANQIIGAMWVDIPNISTYQTAGGNTARTNWDTTVARTLPAGAGTIVVNGTAVTVTVTWRAPTETNAHNFTTTANINQS